MKLQYKIYITLGVSLLTLGIAIFLNKYDIYAGFEKHISDVTHTSEEESTVQEQIADEILRLHVIANSDTDEDQALKLKVKDQIVSYLKEILKDADNLETAKRIVGGRLNDLEKIAKDVITEEGYTYPVSASLGEQEFPVKMYGDLVFPAGIYQAVQVKIGEHQGKNWWCVLFPSLCFVDGTYSIVPDQSKEELEEVIGEDNYKTLLTTEEVNSEISDNGIEQSEAHKNNTEETKQEQNGIPKIEIRLKIADWFSK